MWPFSDETLLARFAAGDPDASAAFVRRFGSRVYGLALSMVGEPEAAEEVAQEAFARAWRAGSDYDPRRARVTTWLLVITRNLAVDHLRARRPEPADPSAAEIADALWVRSARDPADTKLISLREALESLPDEQRRALLLASLFGYTASEIASIEEIPLGTAKTRIRTAMLRLAREPGRELPSGEQGQ